MIKLFSLRFSRTTRHTWSYLIKSLRDSNKWDLFSDGLRNTCRKKIAAQSSQPWLKFSTTSWQLTTCKDLSWFSFSALVLDFSSFCASAFCGIFSVGRIATSFSHSLSSFLMLFLVLIPGLEFKLVLIWRIGTAGIAWDFLIEFFVAQIVWILEWDFCVKHDWHCWIFHKSTAFLESFHLLNLEIYYWNLCMKLATIKDSCLKIEK